MKIVAIIVFVLISYSLHAEDTVMSAVNVISAKDVTVLMKLDVEISSLFKVIKSKKGYSLEIRQRGEKGQCTFKITKISAPQQLRGLMGNISTYGKRCIGISKKNVWTKIDSLTLRYYFVKGGKLEGFAIASTIKNTFRLILKDIKI